MTTAGPGPAHRSPLERRSLFLPAIGLLIGLGLVADFRSYAGADIGFLLDEAARVLDGSRLYVDLVDMNTPLIVLLNVGAVRLARALDLPAIVTYRIGFAVLLLAILLLASALLRRLWPGERAGGRVVLLLLALALFNLPGPDFGQREHLFVALAVPYLLLAAARATGRPVPAGQAILVGLLAGVGFGLKPHFLLLWLGVEAWLRATRRVPLARLTPESAATAGFLALYGLATLIWLPEYLRLLRFLAGPYTNFLYDPFWRILLATRGALVALVALLAFAALRRRARNPELLAVFALGTLACLAAAAAQQKGLSYHQYPPYALATTLLGLTVWSVAESAGHWIGTAYRVTATGVLAMVAVAAWARDASAAMRLVQDWEQVQLEGLIAVVGPLANGGTVYVMSYHIGSAYPLINYTGARSASRFPQLWILGSSYLEQLKGDRPLRYHAPEEMSPSESYLNQAVFEDLRDQEPDVLVVLQPARDLPVNGWRRLDYIAYFGRDPRIAGLLQRYQLAADLQGYLVYERVPDGADRVAPAPAVVPGTQDIVRGRPGDASARILDPEILLPLLAFAGAVALASRRGRPQAG